MPMDRNYAISLVNNLLAECEKLGARLEDSAEYENQILRTKMMASKIFGAESHYIDDLRQSERMGPIIDRHARLRAICKTMLEDLQLENFVELQEKAQAGNQKANEKGSELPANQGDLGELRKLLDHLVTELAQAKKNNAEANEHVLRQAKEFAEQDYARRRAAEEEFERRISGFTFIDLDDSAKSNFHDLLKGCACFEKTGTS
jgi:peptidoglycan hydrolase CwlO-like protein